MKSKDSITQKALAQALGVTDRRIRQMVDEGLLPEARDGRWDLPTCQDRYRLYRDGTESEWNRFFYQVERQAEEVERLMAEALKPSADLKAVQAASVAAQAMFSDLRFVEAAKATGRAERDFLRTIWREKEGETIGALYARLQELVEGGTAAPTFDEAEA